ncbi:hypoxia inducible factor 1 subunit alpha, like [Brachionichthys hirsutus]|uniref:hypoxia inducible factor 1 subunit alpha, like n=1 Tax=Brachionichthys hirsutus TaxID=412623 RepID=UPI003604F65F
MEEKKDEVSVKRSSSEQRKLRSRDAARHRRGQETEVFYELASTLPLPRRVSTHLDKSAIMRVSLSFLRMHRLLRATGQTQKDESEEEEEEDPMDSFYPQVLSGFIMVLTEEGDVIYLTENVSSYIGVTQLKLLGQSLFDFIHPCDQEELSDLLSPRTGASKKLLKQRSERNFFLRMRSTLTSRGRTVNIKSASWKLLHCTGHMRPFGGGSGAPPAPRVMTLLCEPIPHPSGVELPLDSRTFLTRHSMDLRFTHCEGRVTELVGYTPEDLIGRSAFKFHHALDSDHISKSLHTLLSKGQVSTSRYRFLARRGGFVWAETQGTVLYSSKTSQPEAIVCLNFILSAVEQPDVVFSTEQIHCRRAERRTPAPAPEGRGAAGVCDADADQADDDAGLGPSGDAEVLFKLKEQEEVPQFAPEAGDVVATADLSGELSFFGLSSPDAVPDRPQDMCTPRLLRLLSAIFSSATPASSSSSSPHPHPSSACEEETKGKSLKDEVDLEMLAPYISMDDDFQLTFLSSLPEKPSSSSSEPSTATQAVTGSRKRNGDLDEVMSRLLKRQKQDASSVEEELLLNHMLGRPDETDQSDYVMAPGLAGLSQLLTDRDPLFGGTQGVCDAAVLMEDLFVPRPPGPLAPLSPLS